MINTPLKKKKKIIKMLTSNIKKYFYRKINLCINESMMA